jgi:hypothetical protein
MDSTFQQVHDRPFTKKRTPLAHRIPIKTGIFESPIVMNSIEVNLRRFSIIEVVEWAGKHGGKKA